MAFGESDDTREPALTQPDDIDGDGKMICVLNSGLTKEQLNTQLDQMLRKVRQNEKIRSLKIDCCGIELMDSSSLGKLAALAKILQERGGQLTLSNLSGQPLECIERTKLNMVFYIEPAPTPQPDSPSGEIEDRAGAVANDTHGQVGAKMQL